MAIPPTILGARGAPAMGLPTREIRNLLYRNLGAPNNRGVVDIFVSEGFARGPMPFGWQKRSPGAKGRPIIQHLSAEGS